MRLISCPASTLNRTTQSNTRGICINSVVLKVLYFLSAFNPPPPPHPITPPSRVLPACQGAFLQGPRLPLQTRLGWIFNGCPKPRTRSATIRSSLKNVAICDFSRWPLPRLSLYLYLFFFCFFLPVLKLSQLLLHPFLFTVPLLLFGWLALLVSTPLKGTFLRLFFDAHFFSHSFAPEYVFFILCPFLIFSPPCKASH